MSPGGKKIVGGGALLERRRGGEGEFDDDLGASLGAIAGGGVTAVSAGDGADKGEAEAMALGIATFDEALKDAGEEVGGEAGSVVFYSDADDPWLSRNSNRHLRIGARVAELVLHEIREHASAEGDVDGDLRGSGGDDGEALVAIGEGGSVELGDAIDELAEVDALRAQPKGSAVCFSEVSLYAITHPVYSPASQCDAQVV